MKGHTYDNHICGEIFCYIVYLEYICSSYFFFISYRRHRLDSCFRDREDKPRRHRRLSLGGIVFHYHSDILLSEFGSARLNICTEMQQYARQLPRPDLHGTAGSIHHSRRISQESSERTNLQYSYTHCKGGRLRFLHGERSRRCRILLRTLKQHLRCTW